MDPAGRARHRDLPPLPVDSTSIIRGDRAANRTVADDTRVRQTAPVVHRRGRRVAAADDDDTYGTARTLASVRAVPSPRTAIWNEAEACPDLLQAFAAPSRHGPAGTEDEPENECKNYSSKVVPSAGLRRVQLHLHQTHLRRAETLVTIDIDEPDDADERNDAADALVG
jgi:hypothetical protein